ncbi:primase-helicase family protein [Mesorhizobium sp. B1-1-5]|uniref:primase-helicase family protein n=1 Tax=Mesorhizobium sp. B1-1-5 TaxID=2589979 RepID=UPI001129B9B5|nr:primase-helicase family protein [Mesorhizobium sp. B1-1-5]TPO01475.1 hypothetical protein FJ980_20705 [Mesorhizobium sp. B1-1-5]
MPSNTALVIGFPRDPNLAEKARNALRPNASRDGAIVYHLFDSNGDAKALVDELHKSFDGDLTASLELLEDGVEGEALYTCDEIERAFLSGELTFINDAEVWGELTQEIANLPIIVSGAAKHTATTWNTPKPSPFRTVFINQFSQHKVGEKAGRCLVMGALGSSGKRSKGNVVAMYLMGLDIDNGASFEKTAERIRELNYTGILYSTHSSGKGTVEIKRDDYMRWAKLDLLHGEPSVSEAQAYLRALGRYESFVIDGISEITTAHEDTVKFICKTTPFDKFRVLFPLAAPLVVAEQPQTQTTVLREWSKKVIGLGQRLGVSVDRAAVDPSRVFFLPRHPKGAAYRIVLNCGRLLPYEEIPVGTSDADPIAAAGNAMGSRDHVVMADGFDLTTWCAKHGHEFDIAQLFHDEASERIRLDHGNDKLAVECPTDHLHSNPGDPEDLGCYIQSAGMSAESFNFGCTHAGCAAHGRDRLKMLCAAIDAGWFSSSSLANGVYLVESGGEDERAGGGDSDLRAAALGNKPARARVFAEAKTAAALLTEDSPDEDVEAIQRLAAVLRETESERVVKIMKDKTGLAVAKLRKGIDALRGSESEAKSPYHFATLEAGIKALNKEVAMVERGTDVMIVQKREEEDGWKSIRAARTVFAPWKVGKGDDMTPLFPLWEESHLRDYRTEVVFNPYRHGDADPTPQEHYNLYKGLAVDPVAGDWMSLQRHLFHVVCNGDTRLFRFMMGWAADLFQNPTIKPGTALVLHGLKGTGKTLPFVPLQQILGLRHSVKVNNRKHLTGNFNEHMAGKLLVVAEESFWGGDKEADSSLKDQITSDTVLLEKKFADAVPVRDYRRFIILSNASSVVRATPDERRYAATTVSDARIGDTEYFDALVADIYGGKVAPAMLHDLLNLNISDIDLRRPPKTAALVGQIINALPADERWIRGVLLSGSFTGTDGADLLDERTADKWLKESIKITKEMVRESYRSAVKPYGGGQVDPGEIGTFFLSKFKGTEAEIDDTRSGRGKREYVLPPLPEMIAAYERNWTPLDPDTAEDERDFIRAADKNDPDERRRVEKDADDFINAFFKR